MISSHPDTLLFCCDGESPERWRNAFETAESALEFRSWPDVGEASEIRYALLWNPPRGVFGALPSLEVAFSLGAGVDHVLNHPDLPPGLPVVRMNEPALTEGMSEYVIYQVLRFHRDMPAYEAMRAARVWRELPQTRPRERSIGILGLGVLGRDAAVKLAALDFDVHGWSRSAKRLVGVTTHTGETGLAEMLERVHILVCLLPLTPGTRGILGREALGRLRRGSFVINCARGQHVDEAALLDALDSGHVAGAALDVFAVEPLPQAHPLWDHPRVYMTPHVASLTNPLTAAMSVVENIARFKAGQPMRQVVDRGAGY